MSHALLAGGLSSPLTVDLVVNDNVQLYFGTDSDIALWNNSAALAADEEVTGVIIGTSVHPATAANSLVISNVTASGDIMLLTNRGGNSEAHILCDASAGDTFLYARGSEFIRLGGAADDIICSKDLTFSVSNGPAVLNETSSATNPTLIPFSGDSTTGIGGASGTVSVILSSIEFALFSGTQLFLAPGGVSTPALRCVVASGGNHEVFMLETDSATPTDNDNLRIIFKHSDTAGNQDYYGAIESIATTVTDGAGQNGDLVFYNNAGSYKLCANTTATTAASPTGKTWRCSANALSAP